MLRNVVRIWDACLQYTTNLGRLSLLGVQLLALTTMRYINVYIDERGSREQMNKEGRAQ